jgi:hypothetical protein
MVQLCLGAAMLHSQAPITHDQTPITADLTARDTLGETLWTIPVVGRMTPSMDGRRFLLEHSDGHFYLVDQATGAYRLIKSAFPYVDAGGRNSVRTRYTTDEDLTYMLLTQRSRGPDYPDTLMTRVIDLNADTILLDTNVALLSIKQISTKLKRATDGKYLWEFPSMKILGTFGGNDWGSPWIDDAHGIIYRTTPYGVQACDPVSGKIMRGYTFARNEESIVRRPPGSPWIYMITHYVVEGEVNYVVAFHAETGEARFFDQFAGNDQVAVKPGIDAAIGFVNGKLLMGAFIDDDRPNPVWLFDAEAGHSELLIDPSLSLSYIIAPTLGTYTHSSNARGEDGVLRHLTRHRRLVPIGTTTSGGDNETGGGQSPDGRQRHPVWLRQTAGELAVTVPPGRSATSLTVVTADGRVVADVRGADLTSEPVVVSTASWPSGTYVCRLDLGTMALTQSIIIAR